MSYELTLAIIIVTGAVLGLLIVVALPCLLSFRHSARQQEFEHAERMKALELGRPWPGDHSEDGSRSDMAAKLSSSPRRLDVTVPLGALAIAFVATTAHGTNSGAALGIWLAAGAVGVASLICGTILAACAPPPPPAQPEPATRTPDGKFKPAPHEDPLDLVGHRD